MKLFRNKLSNCQIAKLFNVEKKEILLAFVIAVAAASFSLLPTVYAWLSTPEGYWFTGVSSYFDPWDINVYFSAVRQGYDGVFLYREVYDSTDARTSLVYLPYMFLGHVARIFDLPVPFVYHSASFVLGVLFLLVIYFFVRLFLRSTFWSLFCLYLVAFGGGFGFFGLSEGKFLPDTAFASTTTFQALHLPHFALDQLLFLGVLFFSFRALINFDRRYSFLAAVSGIVLCFIHPYSLFVANVVVCVFYFSLWLKDRSWRGVGYLIPLLLVSVITIGYFFKVLFLDLRADDPTIMRKIFDMGWSATPSVLSLFLGYGLVATFAVVGIRFVWKEKTYKSFLLLSWFFGQLLSVYLPVSFQRVMIKGFFIVICLLATFGMMSLNLRRNWIALTMVLIFSSLTNFSIQALTVVMAHQRSSWVYLNSDEHLALEWLRQNSFGKTVLAPIELATMVPAHSPNPVHLSHQGAQAVERRGAVESFYRGDLRSPQEFLRENKIDYVILNTAESALEINADYLREVYKNGTISIFKTSN